MGGIKLEAFKFVVCLLMPPVAVFGIANHEGLMERVLVATEYVRYGRGNSEESVSQEELLRRAERLRTLRQLQRRNGGAEAREASEQ